MDGALNCTEVHTHAQPLVVRLEGMREAGVCLVLTSSSYTACQQSTAHTYLNTHHCFVQPQPSGARPLLCLSTCSSAKRDLIFWAWISARAAGSAVALHRPLSVHAHGAAAQTMTGLPESVFSDRDKGCHSSRNTSPLPASSSQNEEEMHLSLDSVKAILSCQWRSLNGLGLKWEEKNKEGQTSTTGSFSLP